MQDVKDTKILNPQRILLDLAKELDGETVESTVELFNHTWSLSLLNEEESNWRNGYINTGSKLSTISSFRLPTLAIAIRSIDGFPIYEFFAEEWAATEHMRNVKALIDGKGRYTQKYFAAEHLMGWLSSRFADALEPLHAAYEILEKRRMEAQDALKKSSGGSSETETKE
jgi:hypothetical protein